MKACSSIQRHSGQALIGAHRQRASVLRTSGVPLREIKEGAKPGDIRAGEYPVSCAHTPKEAREPTR
jgi:hypothetical protein